MIEASGCFYIAAFKIISLTFDILILYLWSLFESLWVYLVLNSMLPGLGCLFHQVRKVFRHYFFKWSFTIFLSSPSVPLIMLILVYLILSQRSLKLSPHFCVLFFLVAVLIGCFPLFGLPGCWSFLLHHIIYCWLHLMYFSFILFYYWLWLVLFILSLYLLCSHCVRHFFSRVQYHYDHYFELFMWKFAYLFHLIFFWGFALFFFSELIFSVSICLTICVCFCSLSRSAMSPGFKSVTLFKRCPMETQKCGSPWPLEPLLQECSIFVLHLFYCCGWAILAARTLVCVSGTDADGCKAWSQFLWGLWCVGLAFIMEIALRDWQCKQRELTKFGGAWAALEGLWRSPAGWMGRVRNVFQHWPS